MVGSNLVFARRVGCDLRGFLGVIATVIACCVIALRCNWDWRAVLLRAFAFCCIALQRI